MTQAYGTLCDGAWSTAVKLFLLIIFCRIFFLPCLHTSKVVMNFLGLVHFRINNNLMEWDK